MAPKKMTQEDLLALVAEVRKDLTTIAKNEAGKLAKGVPPEGSASPEASASASAPEGGEGAPPSEPSPSPEGAPPPGPDAGAEGAPPSADPSAPPPGTEGAAPAGPSFEELVSLYAALPPEDFEAHAAALQQAMAMKQGGAGAPGAPGAMPPGGDPAAAGGMPPPGPGAGAPPSPGPSAPPPGPSAGPGPSAPPPGPSAGPGPDEMAFKSEIAALRADLKKSQEEQAALGKVIEDVLTMPQRRAVTGLTFVPYKKSEETKPAQKQFAEMTKSEVHAKLKEITATPKLSKSERDLINSYFSGGVNIDALAPIINKQ